MARIRALPTPPALQKMFSTAMDHHRGTNEVKVKSKWHEVKGWHQKQFPLLLVWRRGRDIRVLRKVTLSVGIVAVTFTSACGDMKVTATIPTRTQSPGRPASVRTVLRSRASHQTARVRRAEAL